LYATLSEKVDEQANQASQYQKLMPGVWVATHHFQMGLPYPPIALSTNSFLVELDNGDCLVYNPIQLTNNLKNDLNKRKIKYIILPNKDHLKFSQQWLEAFPNAKVKKSHSFLCYFFFFVFHSPPLFFSRFPPVLLRSRSIADHPKANCQE
jgi:hypothetical protein